MVGGWGQRLDFGDYGGWTAPLFMGAVGGTYVTVVGSRLGQIFCILILHRKKIYVWTLENFNVIFGPFTRRHSLWRRGNTARRHRLWRRGTCCVGTNGRRGADVVPSSAP
jgi:hypothetical protein